MNARFFGLPGCRVVVLHVPPPPHCPCFPLTTNIPEYLSAFPGVWFKSLEPLETGLPCERCARLRRRRLFEACRETGADTLALAHHQDDLVQTYLLNLLFHGEASGTMLPLRLYDEGRVRLIRPFLTTPEKRLIAFARKLGFPFDEHPLSFGPDGQRARIRKFLADLGPSRDLVKRNLARLAAGSGKGKKEAEG